MLHPGAAFAQALQQSNVRKVREAHRGGPGARRPQSHASQAISQNKPQQIGGAGHTPRSRKSPLLAGGGFNSRVSAKPGQRGLPEIVQKRFAKYALQIGLTAVIPEGRSPIRDRNKSSACLFCDPGLYLGSADLSLANDLKASAREEGGHPPHGRRATVSRLDPARSSAILVRAAEFHVHPNGRRALHGRIQSRITEHPS